MEYIAKNIQNKKLSESKFGTVSQNSENNSENDKILSKKKKKKKGKKTNANTNLFNINRFKALVIHVPNTNIFNINTFKALVIHVPVKKRETNNF